MEPYKFQPRLIIIFLLIVIVCLFIFDYGSGNEPSDPKTERIENLFSAYDGSLPALNALIQSNMNDPDSFEHEKTTYINKGNYLIVMTYYRGKNKFGGVVGESITARVDMNGNVLKVIR